MTRQERRIHDDYDEFETSSVAMDVANTQENSDFTNVYAHDSQNRGLSPFSYASKLDGELAFGIAHDPLFGVHVVLPISDLKTAMRNTLVLRGDTNKAVVIGTRKALESFLSQANSNTENLDAEDEHTQFFNLLNNNDELRYVELSSTAIAGIDDGPQKGRYPSNLSTQARQLWDDILDSARYLKNTQGRTSVQKYAILTRMVLDKASNKAINPFAKGKLGKSNPSITEITTQYQEHRSKLANLENQLFNNLWFMNHVEPYDQGVWRFHDVEYIDRRYAIVLETTWLGSSSKEKIIKHLVNNEDFKMFENKSSYILRTSPSCYFVVSLSEYPKVRARMILLFSKDKLETLGIDGSNISRKLVSFEKVARYWARTRKFKRLDDPKLF